MPLPLLSCFVVLKSTCLSYIHVQVKQKHSFGILTAVQTPSMQH